MADFKISDLDAFPLDELQDTDLLEVSWDDSGTFKSRKITGAQVKASKPYLVYVANLTQTGTNAPTAEVLENTLGGTPTFNYVGVGSYEMELTGAFPANLTYVMINAITSSGLSGADRKTDNKIGLASFNTTFTTSNNVFVDTTIEVRVYPSLIS